VPMALYGPPAGKKSEKSDFFANFDLVSLQQLQMRDNSCRVPVHSAKVSRMSLLASTICQTSDVPQLVSGNRVFNLLTNGFRYSGFDGTLMCSNFIFA